MGNTCSRCYKSIGFLRREFQCSFCGKILCSDCVYKEEQYGFHQTIKLEDNEYSTLEWAKHIVTSCKKLVPRFHEYSGWHSFVAFCPPCSINHYLPYVDKAKSIIDNESYKSVRLFSVNYQGRLPQHTNETSIETTFYRCREDAEQHLKVLAKLCGCDVVIKSRFVKGIGEDGNYSFTTYKYEGVAIL